MKDKKTDVFLDLIKGVSPIRKNNKVPKDIPIAEKKESTKLSLRSPNKPQEERLIEKSNFSSFEIEKNNINKLLKKGRIKIDKKIDFHGLSLLDAEELFSFVVKNCYQNNKRCILFVTGKGVFKKNTEKHEGTKLYYGKIRNSFNSWTKKQELKTFILNVEQAGIEQGADGAFLVYLRKKKLKLI